MICVRVPSEKEWKILMEYLQGSVILVSPQFAEKLRDKSQELDGLCLSYDFGGEPDIVVDVVTSEQHYAVGDILEALGLHKNDIVE